MANRVKARQKRIQVIKGRYDVILADCPWPYKAWKGKGEKKHGTADSHYKSMTIEEMTTMATMIDKWANKNCALFMWATPPTILDCFKILEAWGFRYVTFAFVWVKVYENGNPYIGLGHYSRANAEPCLLALRGSMPVAHKGISQIMFDEGLAPVIFNKVTSHSRKPLEQYDRINLLYPNARKLELFARNRRPGWSSMGDQLD